MAVELAKNLDPENPVQALDGCENDRSTVGGMMTIQLIKVPRWAVEAACREAREEPWAEEDAEATEIAYRSPSSISLVRCSIKLAIDVFLWCFLSPAGSQARAFCDCILQSQLVQSCDVNRY
jgi:hypothetical protein